MAISEAVGQRAFIQAPRRGAVTRLLEDERWLAVALLVPTVVLLALFIAYPFVQGVLLAVTDTKVGVPGRFVGVQNFIALFHDSIFRTAVWNTFVYTAVATVFKLGLGLWLALFINRTLFQLGLIHGRINWLGDPDLALISVIIVNVWRGVPFFAISLLAGLQTINPELQEAAAIDGARAWQRFWHVTWPLLLPVTMVVLLFSIIQTFADFQLVYVLTGGGPANATQLFATYAYQIGV